MRLVILGVAEHLKESDTGVRISFQIHPRYSPTRTFIRNKNNKIITINNNSNDGDDDDDDE